MAQSQNDFEMLLMEADQTDPEADAGADIEQFMPGGGTATIRLGDDEVLQKVLVLLALEAGTNIEQFRPATSRTRGFVAVGAAEMVGRMMGLVASGANLEEADENGDTLLHVAAAGSHAALAYLLLTAGADVNARNNLGDTPLLSAHKSHKTFSDASVFRRYQLDINIPRMKFRLLLINNLLAFGADVTARNREGETLLTINRGIANAIDNEATDARCNLAGRFLLALVMFVAACVFLIPMILAPK